VIALGALARRAEQERGSPSLLTVRSDESRQRCRRTCGALPHRGTSGSHAGRRAQCRLGRIGAAIWAPALAQCPITQTTVAICGYRLRRGACLNRALRLAFGVRIRRLLVLHTRAVGHPSRPRSDPARGAARLTTALHGSGSGDHTSRCVLLESDPRPISTLCHSCPTLGRADGERFSRTGGRAGLRRLATECALLDDFVAAIRLTRSVASLRSPGGERRAAAG